MRKFTFILFVVFYSYAVLRYHIGKDIPWDEWFFIFNKAIAWMGLTLIALSILKQSQLNKFHLTRTSLGMTGFIFATLHVINVWFLFNEQRFPKFYTAMEINFYGWSVIILGMISLLIFSFPFFATLANSPNKSKIIRLSKYGVLLNLFHPFLIGYAGWFTPSEWPYYLPPITLLVVLTGTAVFGVRRMKERV